MASQRRDRVAHSNCWVASIHWQLQKIFHGFDYTSMKLAQMDGHAQPWTGLGMVPNLLCTLMAEAGIALRAMERVDVVVKVVVSVFAI